MASLKNYLLSATDFPRDRPWWTVPISNMPFKRSSGAKRWCFLSTSERPYNTFVHWRKQAMLNEARALGFSLHSSFKSVVNLTLRATSQNSSTWGLFWPPLTLVSICLVFQDTPSDREERVRSVKSFSCRFSFSVYAGLWNIADVHSMPSQ